MVNSISKYISGQQNNANEQKKNNNNCSSSHISLLPETFDQENQTIAPSLLANQAFTYSPVSIIESLTTAQRAILNQIIYQQVKFKKIFISNDKLAERTFYCPKTVQRATNRFVKEGLVVKEIGGYNKANAYKLHPLFNALAHRRKLSKYLPNLRLLPWFMALSISMLFSKPFDTNVHANKFKSFNLISSASHTVTTDARTRSKVTATALFSKTKETIEELQAKRRKYMHASEQAVNAIKTLKLTVWGKILLTAYPAEAIRYADDQLYYRKGHPKNPLGLFKSLCQEFCAQKKIEPDWKRVDRLKMLVPWEIGHAEVTENVIHHNYWTNQDTLAKAKEYVPEKAKRFVEPSGRLPAYKITAEQKVAIARNPIQEMADAVEVAEQAGPINTFMAILAQKQKKSDADYIKQVSIAVQLEDELENIKMDRETMRLINMPDEVDAAIAFERREREKNDKNLRTDGRANSIP